MERRGIEKKKGNFQSTHYNFVEKKNNFQGDSHDNKKKVE